MSPKSSSDFTILTISSEAQWKAQLTSADDTLLIGKSGLSLRRSSEYVFHRTIGKPEGLVEPTDLAVDHCGMLLILDGRQSRIAIYDPQQDRLEWIECIGGVGNLATQFASPAAIALTERTLYVADTGNRRVIAFARLNWQVRWIAEAAVPLGSPPQVFTSPPELSLLMEPCDLAVDAEDNLYVLDCANRVIQRFDAGGRLLNTIGAGLLARPVTVAIDDTSGSDISCLLQWIRSGKDPQRHANTICQLLSSAYSKMSDLEQREVREALADVEIGDIEEQLLRLCEKLEAGLPGPLEIVEDRLVPLMVKYQTLLYVLDAESKSVLKFTATGEYLGERVDLVTSRLGFVSPFGLALDQDGNIYLGDRHDLKPEEEDDRFIYKFDAAGHFLPPPITAYRGRTDGLVTDQKFSLYILNGEREEITILKQQAKLFPSGVFISGAFDSRIRDCRWHKLVVKGSIPDKTRVSIAHFASNEFLSANEITNVPSSQWKELINPQDALILDQAGQYLWLRGRLDGDQQAAPVVSRVDVYFQRTSYLRYLPAVYQEAEASRAFLERFLSLFETFLYNLEGSIGLISRTFNPQVTTNPFLPWLAQWLAATLDENWSTEKQRQFLLLAAELYKKRGTRRGFEQVIELFTGEKPIIFEFFQLNCIKDDEVRRVYEQVLGNDPFHFCLLLKPNQVKTEGEYFAVKRIVEADKPAHTHGGVRILEPLIYLDMHTYLELNTYLQKPEMRLEQQSVIGRDSVLTDMDEAGQAERRSRINIDTVLT